MITQPSQYYFVNFANGDMKTGDFGGDVMPLRQGFARNTIKGEDAAFLTEVAKERLYAWNGAQYTTSGDNSPVAAHLETVAATETLAVPTCRIRRQQMYNITYDLENANWASYGAQDYFGYLATPFEEHIDTSISLSDAQSQWVNSHFVDYHDLVKYQAFADRIAKDPVLDLFSDIRSMAKPVFSRYANSMSYAMLDISSGYNVYTPTGWTDQVTTVSQPYWYAERSPYLGHESEVRYIYPQTQGVLYYPRGNDVRTLVDMTSGQLWYFLTMDYNHVNTAGCAMIQIPCTIVTGARSFYARVDAATFLQQFLRVGRGLGVVSGNNFASGVNRIDINNFRAFFVADLTDHTQWWNSLGS